MNEQQLLARNGTHFRTDRLPQAAAQPGGAPQLPQHIGIGPSNLPELLAGSQVAVDRLMVDISERLALVEAKATLREKIVITADCIVIEREASMQKDRKY